LNADWPRLKIEDIAVKVGMGPFGSSIKVSTFVPEGIPVISGQHLHKTRLEDTEYNFITPEHAEELRNANVFRGDVIFTHAGSIGQAAYIPDDSRYERYVLSQRQFFMRCDKQKVWPEFIAYYFSSTEGQHNLLANTSSTGVPSIARPVTYLRSIKIPVPPLPVQRAIAHILGTLEDKIELNRRMNETLEAIARSIFKAWFVDSTADGLPDGWKLSTIGESAQVVGGGTPSTKELAYWEGGTVNWVTPKDLAALSNPVLLDTDRRITELGAKQISSGVLPKGTVLLSSRAPIGYLVISEIPVAINQGFIAMICDGELPNHYIMQWTQANMDIIEGRANGTTFLEISKSSFRPIPIIVPPSDILKRFTEQAEAIHQKIVSNLKESHTLATMRDALLPKLLSGEIRVSEL